MGFKNKKVIKRNLEDEDDLEVPVPESKKIPTKKEEGEFRIVTMEQLLNAKLDNFGESIANLDRSFEQLNKTIKEQLEEED